MKLQPIIMTSRMEQAVAWYTLLLDCEPAYRSEMWTSFPVDGATLALHAADVGDRCTRHEISLISDQPLEVLVDRLESAGIRVERGIEEEPFGRSVLLRDPDGNPIQVNEHRH